MQKSNQQKKIAKPKKSWVKTKKPLLSPEEYQKAKKKMKSPRRVALYQMIFDRIKAIRVESKKNRHRTWAGKVRRFSRKQLNFIKNGTNLPRFRTPLLSRVLQKVMVRLSPEWKKRVRKQFLVSYFNAEGRIKKDTRYLRKAEKKYLTVMWKFRNNFRFRFNKALLFRSRPKKLFPAKFKQLSVVDPMVTRPPTRFFRKATKKAKKLLIFSGLVRKNLVVPRNAAARRRLRLSYSFKKNLIGFLKRSFIFSNARGNGPLFQNLPKSRKKWDRIRFVNGWKRAEILKANDRNGRKFFRDWLSPDGTISKYAAFNDVYTEERKKSFFSLLRSFFSEKPESEMGRGEYLNLWKRHELFPHYKNIKRLFHSDEPPAEIGQIGEKSTTPVENNSVFISPATRAGSAFRRFKKFNSLTLRFLRAKIKDSRRQLQSGALFSNLFKNSQFSKVAARLSTSNFLKAVIKKLRYLAYFFKKFNLGVLRLKGTPSFKSSESLNFLLKRTEENGVLARARLSIVKNLKQALRAQFSAAAMVFDRGGNRGRVAGKFLAGQGRRFSRLRRRNLFRLAHLWRPKEVRYYDQYKNPIPRALFPSISSKILKRYLDFFFFSKPRPKVGVAAKYEEKGLPSAERESSMEYTRKQLVLFKYLIPARHSRGNIPYLRQRALNRYLRRSVLQHMGRGFKRTRLKYHTFKFTLKNLFKYFRKLPKAIFYRWYNKVSGFLQKRLKGFPFSERYYLLSSNLRVLRKPSRFSPKYRKSSPYLRAIKRSYMTRAKLAPRKVFRKFRNMARIIFKRTQNNFFLTLISGAGQVLSTVSGGSVEYRENKFRGTKKFSAHAAFVASWEILRKAVRHGIKKFILVLKNRVNFHTREIARGFANFEPKLQVICLVNKFRPPFSTGPRPKRKRYA